MSAATSGRGATTLKVVAAIVASVLVIAVAVLVTRSGDDPRPQVSASATPPVAATTPGSDEPSDSPGASDSASPSPTEDAAEPVPTDPAVAEKRGAESVLASGTAAATGAWADLGFEEHADDGERPVYVADVDLTTDRRAVDADLVIAWRASEPDDEAVLRLLPASQALLDAGADLQVEVSRDGRTIDHQVDGPGARLLIPLDPPVAAGDPILVRVRLRYRVVDRTTIAEEGGPAGFGLLAWNPEVSLLGHWLPLLTYASDEGPMIPWGDVGAFPPAVWSLVVHSDAQVVTGGVDQPCDDELAQAGSGGCIWSRGIALRDNSAVAYDDAVSAEREVRGVSVRAYAPRGLDGNDAALDAAVGSVESFTSRFGPLAWREFDVVAGPFSAGAAGMEFPGLVVIHDETYADMVGGFGEFVVAHEAAHQWFHALVGNGSLSNPVVDESLAQYLSVLYWADTYGEQAADQFVDQAFIQRYDQSRESGVADVAPASPLGAFTADQYSAMVYARAPLGWVAAEDAVGREAVVAFIAGFVERHALGFVTDEQLLEEAQQLAPEVHDVLQRYWVDPQPVR